MAPLRLTFQSDAEEIGGAERSLGTLLRHLDTLHRVELVVADRGVGEFLAAQRPVARVRIAPPPRARYRLDLLVRLLVAVIASRPQVLHVNRTWLWVRPLGMLAGILSPGTRTVVVEHSQPQPPRRRIGAAIVRWAARRLDAIVAVSDNSARAIERLLSLPGLRVRTIHNGIETAPAREPRTPGPAPAIGAVGRISAEKGFEDLVELLRRLPAARVVLVGDGPGRGELEAKAAAAGVRARLELAGWQEDPSALLAGFDLLVAPSRVEGSPPLSALEAMMAGVPVVAADVGAVSEAVEDGVTGLLVPVADPDALAAAVERLLADPELRARLVRAARERVSTEFGAARMAARFEALYAELLA